MQEHKKACVRGAVKRILRYIEDTLECDISFLMMTFLIISFMMQIRFETKKQEEVQIDIIIHLEIGLFRGYQRSSQLTH